MNSLPPYNNIHQFLTLLEIPTWSTWQVPIEKPFIDYIVNIMMTYDHYVIRLEQKLQLKETIMTDVNIKHHPLIDGIHL
jgi:hypothetical protein